ncbi:MAG: hypothetical protein QXU02_03080, partial [Candidatus Bathyarchaeia archaeon]
QIIGLDGKRALTIFKGHEYSRDYLRSLIRRKTTKIDGIFDVITKDGYKLRVAACAFTTTRIKTSQEREIRAIMKKIIEEKAQTLSFDQFVQEAVLGKIASDIYNNAKKVAPLRHVGIRKTKLLSSPGVQIPMVKEISEAEVEADAELSEAKEAEEVEDEKEPSYDEE